MCGDFLEFLVVYGFVLRHISISLTWIDVIARQVLHGTAGGMNSQVQARNQQLSGPALVSHVIVIIIFPPEGGSTFWFDTSKDPCSVLTFTWNHIRISSQRLMQYLIQELLDQKGLCWEFQVHRILIFFLRIFCSRNIVYVLAGFSSHMSKCWDWNQIKCFRTMSLHIEFLVVTKFSSTFLVLSCRWLWEDSIKLFWLWRICKFLYTWKKGKRKAMLDLFCLVSRFRLQSFNILCCVTWSLSI